MSAAPLAASSTSDSTNDRDSAKPIMNAPNATTERRNVRPICRPGGRSAMNADINTAPIAGAARSAPRPVGPTNRISAAKIGRIATAPPNSTANRSRVIAPMKIGRVKRKAQALAHAGDQRGFGARRTAGGPGRGCATRSPATPPSAPRR